MSFSFCSLLRFRAFANEFSVIVRISADDECYAGARMALKLGTLTAHPQRTPPHSLPILRKYFPVRSQTLIGLFPFPSVDSGICPTSLCTSGAGSLKSAAPFEILAIVGSAGI